MKYPLTITTTSKGPYNDSFNGNGMLSYSYRGNDPNHRDNIGLRECMKRNIPLIYLHSIIPGKYLAVFPVFIVGDELQLLKFTVVADELLSQNNTLLKVAGQGDESRRAYITASVKQRLHQRGFRERVLEAYGRQCSFCMLKHEALLDAAHIIADNEPDGEPLVQNGISLCKIHHAAYDIDIIGISPDCIINVRQDILDETDGPMLKHGLQELHGHSIQRPRNEIYWPRRDFLDRRYEAFKKSA
jgi:putative restriction endonuclease